MTTLTSLNWLKLRLDCGEADLRFQRDNRFPSDHFWIDHISGSALRTTTGVVSIARETSCLFLNHTATTVVRTGVGARLLILPPSSVCFVQGPARLAVLVSRGQHKIDAIAWRSPYLSALESWIREIAEGGKRRSVATSPIDPEIAEPIARLLGAQAPPFAWSAMSQLAGILLTREDRFRLATLPKGLPDTILQLTKEVRENPQMPWPLSEAADLAGYSPFHFSRIFKQFVGIGFHEFSDRCRTEAAVELLSETDQAIDAIATICGFGTAQGLRESLKDYLGLVPSELRAVPDGPAAFDL